MEIILLICLMAGFFLLFFWMRRENILRSVLQKSYETMDMAARRRIQDDRKTLLLFKKQKGILYRLEKRLIYSGLRRRFPYLTAEIWLLVNLIVCAGIYFVLAGLTESFKIGIAGIILLQIIRQITESFLMGRNYRAVNDNLLKFLDFLGNYSITAGEVTGILNQISRYMDEPLSSVLDECYYEAQTSGDATTALLAMAEKVEHQRFKELVRNMEISIRYSADFTVLVRNSRHAVREHLRTRQERKSLANEAVVNMLILAGMSVVVLMSVEQLIAVSIREILFHTLPGRVGVGIIITVFALLYGQIRRIDQ